MKRALRLRFRGSSPEQIHTKAEIKGEAVIPRRNDEDLFLKGSRCCRDVALSLGDSSSFLLVMTASSASSTTKVMMRLPRGSSPAATSGAEPDTVLWLASVVLAFDLGALGTQLLVESGVAQRKVDAVFARGEVAARRAVARVKRQQLADARVFAPRAFGFEEGINFG